MLGHSPASCSMKSVRLQCDDQIVFLLESTNVVLQESDGGSRLAGSRV